MAVSAFPSVTFLNHSSVLVSAGQTRILCDPWFEGAAFQNGWRLLYEHSHRINELDFDSIWISHEHPDHFSTPTLKQLEGRRRFIYQATQDQKVARWLSSRQHEVIEIADQQTHLFGDIATKLYGCDGYDSAMLFTFPDGRTFLNLNDARVELDGVIDRIAADAMHTDLVAIQFSYANYAGNPGDADIPRDQHEAVLSRIRTVVRHVQPKAVLLFASFVYFSHQENFYWNQHFWLSEIVRKLEAEGVRVIVPIPDQTFVLDDLAQQDFSPLNREAIAFWTARHDAAQPVDVEEHKVGLADLRDAYLAFRQRLWTGNDLALARSGCPREDLPLRVKLSDHPAVIELGLLREQFDLHSDDAPFNAIVSSNTLNFLFEHQFSRGTVTINSRIQFHYPTAHRFFIFFFIYYANNIGRYFRAGGGLSWANLHSIQHVAVLESIVKFHPECSRNLQADLSFIAGATSSE